MDDVRRKGRKLGVDTGESDGWRRRGGGVTVGDSRADRT